MKMLSLVFTVCFFLAAVCHADPQSLKLLLKPSPKPNYGAEVPAQISGRVISHANGAIAGVAGVSVTDGYGVVKTNARGQYRLRPNASAVFVYITRPAGYDLQGDWYQPLSASVDFELKPVAMDENEYIFVHVTDTHVSANPRSTAGLSRFVQEVNSLNPKPRFVINSGDLLNLSKSLTTSPEAGHTSFRNYVGIMNHLSMPHYNVAGDHTDSSYRLKDFPRGDHRCGKPMYWEYLGPHFFSFEYGKIHFVSVDYGYHLGKRQLTVNGKKREYPTLGVQPMHVKWLNQDMAGRTKGTFVITTSEHDLMQHCPDFLAMAKQHDIRLQLVGDTHIVSYKSKPVPCRTGGALAGCWWNPKTNQLCPDLSPQGYLIYHVRGDQLETFYKGLGQRVAIVSHRLGAAWQGKVKVQAHIVQPQPGEKLEYSLNENDWQPMQEIGRPFYRALFQASIDSTKHPEGLLNFRTRSTSSGEVRSRIFVVANGQESAPRQSDASLTLAISPKSSWATKSPEGRVNVLFNDKVVGVIQPQAHREISFPIPVAILKKANRLTFEFEKPDDAMILGSPTLVWQKQTIRDPRDEALRKIKTAHWGASAADWGGFIAGDAQPPDETPFHRRQNVFCFVLGDNR